MVVTFEMTLVNLVNNSGSPFGHGQTEVIFLNTFSKIA